MARLRNLLKHLAAGGPVTGPALPAASATSAPTATPPAAMGTPEPQPDAMAEEAGDATDDAGGAPAAEPTPGEVEAWERQREDEEALFFANLAMTSGRDCAAWMAWLDGMEQTARVHGMIELLQREGGFPFRWASVLERTWARGRGTPAGPSDPEGLTADAEPAAPVREPPTANRPRDVRYPHTPREHAEALAAHVHRLRAKLPAEIFWERLKELHGQMCGELGWPVRPWNPVATALIRLIGEPRPLWQWVAGPKGPQKVRFYSIEMIAAAAASLAAPVVASEAREPMRAAA